MEQPTLPLQSNSDEINLFEYVYVLVKYKWWIIGLTLIGFLLGYGAAIKKGPSYIAEAVIAKKETESQQAPNFSGLGALGGLVASQFNFGGNASLDKIMTVLNSRDFNAALIDKYGLTNSIIRFTAPKTYKKYWDPNAKAWKKGVVLPKRLDLASLACKLFLRHSENEDNTLTISITTPDSTFSEDLINRYLDFLNIYLQESVIKDASANIEYLDKQLVTIADPLLREKLQALTANELEKMMLVSKEAFKIIDSPYWYGSFKQKLLYPLMGGFVLFLLSSLALLIGHALNSIKRTSTDNRFITNIRKELFSFPGFHHESRK
jgi:LPS O-antigen subunit length determinant protein (WzzB/FepE family)